MQDRDIYEFFDGRETVKADPLELLRDVRYHAGQDPEKLVDLSSKSYDHGCSQMDFTAGRDAEKILVGAVRKTFGLPEVDRKTGQGLTLDQVKSVWNDFCRWLNQKKTTHTSNSSPTSPTSSPAPASPSPTPSTSASC